MTEREKPGSKQQEQFYLRKNLQPVTGEALWFLVELLNVEVEGHEYIQEMKTHIKNGGSIVFYSNHESHADEGIIYTHVVKKLRKHARGITIIAGSKLFPDFYDDLTTESQKLQFAEEITAHKQSANSHDGKLLFAAAKRVNMSVIPVVQSFDPENPLNKLNSTITVNQMRKFRQKMEQRSQVGMVMITSTRSDTGEIDLARSALNPFFRGNYDNNHVMFVPIGIDGTRNALSKDKGIKNLRAKIHMKIGKPFFAAEIIGEKTQSKTEVHYPHLLMRRVLDLVPVKKWGKYLQFDEFLTYYNSLNHSTKPWGIPKEGLIFDAKETSNG